MNKNMKTTLVLSGMLIAAVLLSGCVEEISNNVTVTPSPTPTLSPTPTPEVTPPIPLKKEINEDFDGTPALAGLLEPGVSNVTAEDIGFEVTMTDEVHYLPDVGKPSVPYIIKKFEIAGHSEVKSVSVNLRNPIEIHNIFIEPAPQPVPSKYNFWQNFTYPPYTIDNETYASHEPYPGKEYKYWLGGDPIHGGRVVVHIYPIQYFPAEGRIVAHKNASVSIVYHVPAQEEG